MSACNEHCYYVSACNEHCYSVSDALDVGLHEHYYFRPMSACNEHCYSVSDALGVGLQRTLLLCVSLQRTLLFCVGCFICQLTTNIVILSQML